MQNLPAPVFAHSDLRVLRPVMRRVCSGWCDVTQPTVWLDWYHLLEHSLEHGHITLLDWMWTQPPGVGGASYLPAVRAGSVEGVQWLIRHEVRASQQNMMASEALRCGHLELARLICTSWECHPEITLSMALSAGDLNLCKYLVHKKGHRLDSRGATDSAVGSGKVPILEWVLSQGALITGNELRWAIHGGHREMASWISIHMTSQCRNDLWQNAATRFATRPLDMLRWLRVREWAGDPDDDTMRIAVRDGCLPTIQWLIRYCIWQREYTALAAREGHLHVLRWAWDTKLAGPQPCMAKEVGVAAAAAMSGKWAVWQWALAHGYAAEIPAGCLEHILRQHGTDMEMIFRVTDVWTSRMIVDLLNCGKVQLQYVYARLGVSLPWDESVSLHLALSNKYRTLRWAIEQGCPWNAEVYAACRKSKDPTLLPWLDNRVAERRS